MTAHSDEHRPDDGPPITARALLTTTAGHLTIALLTIELIAGMQTYLLSTMRPLVAADLDGHHLYGAVTGITQVAMFLTIPVGAVLLGRYPAATLLIRLTALTALGAVVCAAAPTMEVFLAGRAIAGLASGALITVSYGAIVRSLPGPWRRMVLAGYAAVWVVASLLGPAYAAWISEALSWRWALVLYLPPLLLARIAVARQLRRLGEEVPDRAAGLSWRPALVLAVGVAGVSLLTSLDVWRISVAVAGAVVTILALGRLLPPGTARLARGRPAAIAAFAVLCGVYFGAEAIMAIVAHDVIGAQVSQVGALLMAGGLGWSVTGLVCGRLRPRDDRAYRRRAGAGALTVALGTAGSALAAHAGALPLLVAGWAVAGIGMGLVYLDTMDRILAPAEDGLTEAQATTAAALGETVPTALISTVTAAVLGAAVAEDGRTGPVDPGLADPGLAESNLVDPGLAATGVLAALAVLALAMLPALRRA